MREAGPLPGDSRVLAARIKAIRIRLTATTGMERAISTAGGVRFEDLDAGLQLRARPGVWVAGEMLDWEAPTGGYLLQAVFATGVHAARDILVRTA
jgi:predicted flavoprotein YhiN